MGWVAGADVATGTLITAAVWNNYMGAAGSFEYLKAVADLAILEDGSNAFTADQPMGGFSLTGLAASAAAGESVRHEQLFDASQNDVTGSRAIDGTVYRNTSGKIKLVLIDVALSMSAADGDLDGTAYVTVHSDSSTPPTTVVERGAFVLQLFGLNVVANQGAIDQQLCFIVLVNDYYKATASSSGDGGTSLVDWFEWDLH